MKTADRSGNQISVIMYNLLECFGVLETKAMPSRKVN